MYEKLITKTLVLYEIYFLYESGIFKNYFHTLYEISTTPFFFNGLFFHILIQTI